MLTGCELHAPARQRCWPRRAGCPRPPTGRHACGLRVKPTVRTEQRIDASTPVSTAPGSCKGKPPFLAFPGDTTSAPGAASPASPPSLLGPSQRHPLRWAYRSLASRKARGAPRARSSVWRQGAAQHRVLLHRGYSWQARRSQAHTWRLGLTRARQAARTVFESSPGGGTGDRLGSGNGSSRLQMQMVRCLGRSRRCLARLWDVLCGTERLPNPSPLLLPSPPLPKPVPCTLFCPKIALLLQVHQEKWPARGGGDSPAC